MYLYVYHESGVYRLGDFPGHLPAWSIAPLIGLPYLLDTQYKPLLCDTPIEYWAEDGVVWVTTHPYWNTSARPHVPLRLCLSEYDLGKNSPKH